MQKRGLILFLVVCLGATGTSQANAWFGPKAGDVCKILGEKKSISGKPYICENDSLKKPRWLVNIPPTDSTAALSLVTFACTIQWDNKMSVYMAPVQMMGGVWQKAIDDGRFSLPTEASAKRMMEDEIRGTASISNKFETAASLDSKWSRINSLWSDGIEGVYNRWKRGGISFNDAINTSVSNLDAIESFCKVALAKSDQAAILEHRSTYAWLLRNAKSYL